MSSDKLSTPLKLPGATEPESETTSAPAAFSLDPQSHTLYTITSAYGDFTSVVALDLSPLSSITLEDNAESVLLVMHITTVGPFNALAPINWVVPSLRHGVTRGQLSFVLMSAAGMCRT